MPRQLFSRREKTTDLQTMFEWKDIQRQENRVCKTRVENSGRLLPHCAIFERYGRRQNGVGLFTPAQTEHIVRRIARTVKFVLVRGIGECHGPSITLLLSNAWKKRLALVHRTATTIPSKDVRHCTILRCVRPVHADHTKMRRRSNVWLVTKTRATRFGFCCWSWSVLWQ